MWASLAAWLVMVAWFANVGHLSLVTHAICKVHGELVHADSHPHHEASASPERGGHDTAIRRPEAHDHDHCVATAAQSTAEQLPLFGTRSVTWLRTGSRANARRPTRSRLYLLAPKTSPPGWV